MNRKILFTMAAFAIMCSTILAFSPASDAENSVYGSNTEPYSGLHVDYRGLEDGATYYLMDSGPVYISFSGFEIGDVESQLNGTGLTVDRDSEVIYGQIEKTSTLKIGEKTITVVNSGVIYGQYPSYGKEVDAFPNATVGTFYRESVVLYTHSGILGAIPPSAGFILHESSSDIADQNLSISFTTEEVSSMKHNVLATISGTPIKPEYISMVIWSSSNSMYHSEYTTSINIENPTYTITLNPGAGSCSTGTMTYSSPSDNLELPGVTPPDGYHFTGWYTDASGGTFVGMNGDNPFDVFTPNGNFTLYAHYAEDTNPVIKVEISGSSSIGVGETTYLIAESTLANNGEDGDRHVVWDVIDGSNRIQLSGQVDLQTGGRITVKGLSAGTATIRAMSADGSVDDNGQRVCDYFTISVTESQVERNTFTLVYKHNQKETVYDMPPTFSTTSTQSYYTTQVAALEPRCTGYEFKGWSYSNSAKTVDLLPEQTISLTPGTNYLYAVFEEINTVWTLSFDPYGGTGGPAMIEETENSSYHVFRVPGAQYVPNPPDASMEFGGWSKEPGSNVVAVYPGGSFTATEFNTTLYAIWNEVKEENTFTIHFDANRGTEAPDDIERGSTESRLSIELPDREPSRPGYDFKGWSQSASWNSGDDLYQPNDSITIYPGTTTLYAIWSQSSFVITFNDNNGTGGPGTIVAEGSGSAQIMIPTDKTPSRDGFKFVGWSTDANGQADPNYAPGRHVFLNGNITLYAVWIEDAGQGGDDEVTYTFIFIVGDGVEGSPGDQVVKGTKDGVSFRIPDETPTTTGLRFLGWSNIDNSDSVVWYPGEMYEFDSPTTYFYPVWERGIDTWSLSFHPNGGIGAPATIYETVDGTEYKFEIPSDPQPTREGYVFLGWDASPDVNRPSIPAIGGSFTARQQESILYAIWAEGTEDVFTLSFDLQGGTDGPASISENDVGSHKFTIPLKYPVMDGFIFVGWSESVDGDAVAYVGGDFVSRSQDKTLYAVWEKDDGIAKNFVVIYHPYRDSDVVERKVSSNGSSAVHTLMTVDDSEFIPRAGYKFIGWSETEGGITVDGETYTTGSMHVVLYGVWASDSNVFPEATIEYDSNGLTIRFDGSGSPNSTSFYWDVGDGTKYGKSAFEHTYKEPGTYKVTLTVSNDGKQDTKTIYITVEDSGLSIWTYVAIISMIAVMIVVILRWKGVI